MPTTEGPHYSDGSTGFYRHPQRCHHLWSLYRGDISSLSLSRKPCVNSWRGRAPLIVYQHAPSNFCLHDDFLYGANVVPSMTPEQTYKFQKKAKVEHRTTTRVRHRTTVRGRRVPASTSGG